MKVAGNGQGKVLTAAELERLFSEGLVNLRDRTLFAICLFTGCRISEALALQVTDIKNKTITFRKSIYHERETQNPYYRYSRSFKGLFRRISAPR